MFPSPDQYPAFVDQLATYLASRREALLDNWQTACQTDPSLKSANRLNRDEFTNNVPLLLNLLQEQLRGQDKATQVGSLAAEHGLHRWQKGYNLAELSAEMVQLSNLLLADLRLFWQAYPSPDCSFIPGVYEHFSRFANQITIASVGQYADLQRNQAASRVEALEKTLHHLNELGQQRAELLRHSSHDLRGSFGAIQGAATLLELVLDSEEDRKQMLTMLLRNLTTCRLLVTQMMDLARLEAGQETLHIQRFDAGQLLTDLVAGYQPLAAERGLSLTADGPASLPVVGDPVHLQRIIQNLVLNALKHTPAGFVTVSWTSEDASRWIVGVQDSGPGLPTPTQAGPLPQVVAHSQACSGQAASLTDTLKADTTQVIRSAFAHQGEGIGLSIVKGLCELLHAQLEIESEPGEGTLFRIRLAIHDQA